MTLAYWCVLIAALLPWVATGIAKAGDGSYNNKRPRAWAEGLSGYRRRAIWAQNNAFEIFPFFAAAVIIASLAGGSQSVVDGIAILFIAARVSYLTCYLADLHLFRSLSWLVGLGCCIALFIVAA